MEKYTYKDSGFEWLGEIPEHWKTDRVKDVSRLRDEKVQIKSSDKNYLELENLEQGTGKVIGFQDTLEVISKVMTFKKGDVLFGKLRPYLEKYYLTQEDGYCTGEILAMEPKSIDNLFFKYFIGSPNFIKQCDVFSYGAKMPRVNWQTQIGTFEIPIPPPKEQKAIAEYLDKATAKVDRIIAIKQEQLVKMEEMFKDKVTAILSGLNSKNNKKTNLLWVKEIPSHWKLAKLSHLIEVKDGTHDTPSYEYSGENNFPFVTSKDITYNEIDFSDTKFISPEYHNNYFRRSNPKRGDIIMPMIGTIGNSAIVNTNIEFSIKNVALFKTSESLKINTKFLFYFLESELNMNQFYLESKGGVQTFLSLTVLRNLKIILPPKDEQDEIVILLDVFSDKLKSTKKNIKEQIKTLQVYRKNLIHECVTGKKQVTSAIKNQAYA
jgi:type I restriction enzyme S subunit